MARDKWSAFLNTVLPEHWDYSEATAQEIDDEIKEIISQEHEKALNVLKEKRQS
ncbi:MAG: hypothetical protein ACMUIM_03315 [bacterium]